MVAKPPITNPARDELRSVGKALELLDLLGASDRPIGVMELSRELRIAPSSAHRLLSTFLARGYATQSAAGAGYRRGPAVIRLRTHGFVTTPALTAAARPLLRDICLSLGETTHLMVLDGLDVVELDMVQSPGPVAGHHAIGARVPPHATAAGHALLAHSPEAAEVLIELGLVAHTRATIVRGDVLRRVLRSVQTSGYALNDRQWHEDWGAVAAPVLGPAGQVIAAIAITVPARHSTPRNLAQLGRAARMAASHLADRLYTPDYAHGR